MAVLQNNEKRAVIETHFTSTNNDGLLPHEISCLASILLEAEGTDSHVNIYSVKKAMERAGYNTLASNIALKKLMNIRYLDSEMDSYERDYPIECYKITKFGWDWVNRNFGLLDLKATPISENHKSQARAFDEQIPF